jgi:hypothetical protein
VPKSILADGNLTEVYFEQTSLFIALFLLALAGLLADRLTHFFLIWGIAFVVNPMYGAWAALFFAVTYAADPERPPIGRLAKRAPIFLLLAAPMLVSSLRVFMQPNPSPELWEWVMRLLNSPHLAAETWRPVVWRDFSIFVVLVGASALAIKNRRPRLTWLMLAWSGFAVAVVGLGVWAAASERGLGVLSVQPARASDLYYLSAGVAVVSLAGFLAESRATGAALAVACLSIGAMGYLLSPSFGMHGVRIFVVSSVLGVLALAIARHRAMAGSRRWRPRRLRVEEAAAVTICLLLALASSGAAARSLRGRVKEQGSLRAALYRGPSPRVKRIANWARTSVGPEAVFLHDPISWDWAHFRYLSERPVYVTWKDGSAVQWEPSYSEEWSRRFAAMGFKDRWRDRWDVSKFGEIGRIRQSLKFRYSKLSDGDIRSMRSEFSIDYWVAPLGAPTAWPVVFTSEDYQVVELPPARPGSP